ncbi:hypothetical protein ACCY16_22605, partial [Candidatus Pantoea formicae]|uniref:hypothetical protein n=1 Tax=Candidatus Pantoea formicae TaxID=2608355 RepID=UPI003ED8A449
MNNIEGGFFLCAIEYFGAGRSASAAAGPSSRRFAVPSAATSCRPERSGTAVLAYPNCLSHPCDWLL